MPADLAQGYSLGALAQVTAGRRPYALTAIGQVRTLTTRGWAMRLQRIARSYTFSNEEDW